MDSFGEGFSSPNHAPTPKPSASPKPSFSGETKENDISNDEMRSNSKSQNPNKPVTKHFMSPTISAISKVSVQRKKILAEKNESSASHDNSHCPESPILKSRNGLTHSGSRVSHSDQTSSQANSACVNAFEFDDGELNTCFADSSFRPYDPLTNYLSPRPKYLRYKPNRRLEILKRSGVKNSQNQKIVGEEKSYECDQEEPLNPPPQEGSQIMMVKVEDNHNDGQGADDDEEEEESEDFEDVKCWSLKGLVKFLLLLFVIGLSTSFISSMNSPRPSPAVQAIGGLREGYHRLQKNLFEIVYTNVHSGAWRNGSGDGKIAYSGFNLNGDHEFGRVLIDLVDEEELEDITDEIIEIPEPPNGELEHICEDDERDEDLHWPDWKIAENKDINSEVKETAEGSEPVCESAQTDMVNDQKVKVEEVSEGLQQCASLKRSECIRERMDDTESSSGKEHTNLIFKGDQLENDHKADQFERSIWEKAGEGMAGTRLERAEDDASTSREGKIYHKVEEVEGISSEKVGEETYEAKMKISEATPSSVEDENFLPAKMESDNDAQSDASRSDIDVKKSMKFMDLGPIALATILFSGFSIVLAYLVYIYPPTAIPALVHDSQLEVPDRREKLVQAKACVEVEHMEERAKSIIKPSSVSFSFEDTRVIPARLHDSQLEVPDRRERLVQAKVCVEVEHMEERAKSIIKPSSVSFSFEDTRVIPAPLHDSQLEVPDRRERLVQAKACVEDERMEERAESIMKPSSVSFSFEDATKDLTNNHAPDVELLGEFVILDRKGGTIETEESISLIPHVESRAHPVAQAHTLHASNTDSPLYGSFTAEKIIFKKEGDKDGNVKKVVTTPVRRSSRIRNLSVTSP